VNPEQGLYLGLEAEGKVWRITTDQTIDEAIQNGPSDTRGGLRGLCVQRFPDRIKSIQWEQIQFTGGLRSRTLDMGDLFAPGAVRRCAQIFQQASSPTDALTVWNNERENQV
jgi:proteasome accessory factor A